MINLSGIGFLNNLIEGKYYSFFFILKDKPNPDLLSKAWKQTLIDFPMFNYTIILDGDKCCYAPYDSSCLVKEENQIKNNEYNVIGKDMIAVTYKDNTVCIRYSHCFMDGYGFIFFAKRFFERYFALCCKDSSKLGFTYLQSKHYVFDESFDLFLQKNYNVSTDLPDIYKFGPCHKLNIKKNSDNDLYYSHFYIDKGSFDALFDKMLGENFNRLSKGLEAVGGIYTIFSAVVAAYAIKKSEDCISKVIKARCPINARKVLDIPKSIKNASMAQAILEFIPSELTDKNIKKLIIDCSDRLKKQTSNNIVQWQLTQMQNFLLKKPVNEEAAKLLEFTMVVSDFGEFSNKIYEYFDNMLIKANPSSEMLIYTSRLNDKLIFHISQTFSDNKYIEQFKGILENLNLKVVSIQN